MVPIASRPYPNASERTAALANSLGGRSLRVPSVPYRRIYLTGQTLGHCGDRAAARPFFGNAPQFGSPAGAVRSRRRHPDVGRLLMREVQTSPRDRAARQFFSLFTVPSVVSP